MILIITGVFLIIIDRDSPEDSSQKIYEKEQGILRGIQLNDSLRENILSFDVGILPIEWDDFPENLKEKIISKTPSYLECKAKICNANEDCILSEFIDKDVYTQEVIITSTSGEYSPRKLKLFCWEI